MSYTADLLDEIAPALSPPVDEFRSTVRKLARSRAVRCAGPSIAGESTTAAIFVDPPPVSDQISSERTSMSATRSAWASIAFGFNGSLVSKCRANAGSVNGAAPPWASRK
jgi:hypothetical protein